VGEQRPPSPEPADQPSSVQSQPAVCDVIDLLNLEVETNEPGNGRSYDMLDEC
jgi:hypothetical protein